MPLRLKQVNDKPHRRLYQWMPSFALLIVFISSSAELVATPPADTKTLTTQEIIATFSDTLDQADVIDAPGTRAETHWDSSGTFHTRWWSKAHKGEARGQWTARNNERCTRMTSITAAKTPVKPAAAEWRCAQVLLLPSGQYLSLNPDGSAHGAHTLSKPSP